VKDALNAAKNFLGIGSPSKVFHKQVGAMISLGTAGGITDNAPRVVAAVKGMVSTVVKAGTAAAAAAEMLKHLRGGGKLSEDFSFKGASANARKFNDQLAKQFYQSGGKNVERFLMQASTVPRTVVAASPAQGAVTTYTFGPGSITLDVTKLKSIDDVVNAVQKLKPTSRQYVTARKL
jgi:hypothetical protein